MEEKERRLEKLVMARRVLLMNIKAALRYADCRLYFLPVFYCTFLEPLSAFCTLLHAHSSTYTSTHAQRDPDFVVRHRAGR